MLADLTTLEKELLNKYSSVVGSIGFPAKMCSPELSQAYSMLSRNLADPQPVDARNLRRLLHYVYHHMDEVFTMRRPENFDPANSPFILHGFFSAVH